jgi:cGMP-dependent protein kinase 1
VRNEAVEMQDNVEYNE